GRPAAVRPPGPARPGHPRPGERRRAGLGAHRRPARGPRGAAQPRSRGPQRRRYPGRRRRDLPALASRQRSPGPSGAVRCQDGAVDRRNVRTDLQDQLNADLVKAGYYPVLVQGVLPGALAGGEGRGCVGRRATTFGAREVRRHLRARALSPTRLVMARVDDVPTDDIPSAAATTEAGPLSRIASVALMHGVTAP